MACRNLEPCTEAVRGVWREGGGSSSASVAWPGYYDVYMHESVTLAQAVSRMWRSGPSRSMSGEGSEYSMRVLKLAW